MTLGGPQLQGAWEKKGYSGYRAGSLFVCYFVLVHLRSNACTTVGVWIPTTGSCGGSLASFSIARLCVLLGAADFVVPCKTDSSGGVLLSFRLLNPETMLEVSNSSIRTIRFSLGRRSGQGKACFVEDGGCAQMCLGSPRQDLHGFRTPAKGWQ